MAERRARAAWGAHADKRVAPPVPECAGGVPGSAHFVASR
jgi:hypothetical protein